jgi:hypothetical protein
MSLVLHSDSNDAISCVPIPSDVTRRLVASKGSAAVLSVSAGRVKVAATKIMNLPIIQKMSLSSALSKKGAKTSLDENITLHNDLINCLDFVANGEQVEVFLRAQALESAGGTDDERANDASHLWPLNFPTLKTIAASLTNPSIEYDMSHLSDAANVIVTGFFQRIVDKSSAKEEGEAESFRLNLVADEDDKYPNGFSLEEEANLQGVQIKPSQLKKMQESKKRAREEDEERTMKRLMTKDPLIDVTSFDDSSDVVLRVNLKDAKVTTDPNGKLVIVGSTYA